MLWGRVAKCLTYGTRSTRIEGHLVRARASPPDWVDGPAFRWPAWTRDAVTTITAMPRHGRSSSCRCASAVRAGAPTVATSGPSVRGCARSPRAADARIVVKTTSSVLNIVGVQAAVAARSRSACHTTKWSRCWTLRPRPSSHCVWTGRALRALSACSWMPSASPTTFMDPSQEK